MADTHGYQVVIESGVPVLRKALQGAWKSAECPPDPGHSNDTGRIPEFMNIPAGTMLGGFKIADGQVQIPQNELDAAMAPQVNGVDIKLGLYLQTQIDHPPVPSAGLFTMRADLRARIPAGTLPNSKNVGLLLANLARPDVRATLTSGDPLAAKLDILLKEFIHKAYENYTPAGPINPNFPVIPHRFSQIDSAWGNLAMVDVYGELYDDDANPAHQIQIARPDPTHIEISIPVYMRVFHIRGALASQLRDPFGVETRMIITAPFDSPPGAYTARLSQAVVVSGTLTPAPGLEGANYTTSNTNVPLLGNFITSAIASRGQQLAIKMGDMTLNVPTVDQIQNAIADVFFAELKRRGSLSIWTPEASGTAFTANDVSVRAEADALYIAVNAGGGADLNALTTFIPNGREFAIGVGADQINKSVVQSRQQNHFADSDLPKRLHQNGKDVDLKKLNVFLVDGAIRMTGSVTVINAILGKIDVDADFKVDVGFHWDPDAALNADGVQKLEAQVIGDPEVDPQMSVAAWIITIILAVVSFGLGGFLFGLITVLVFLIVSGVAESIGSGILVDQVTGALKGIRAWPPDLSQIGQVNAVFQDPVTVDTSGMSMAGNMQVISSCDSTAVVPAQTAGAYSIPAAALLNLAALNTHPNATYTWLAGDGSPLIPVQDLLYSYTASGMYVAKHALTINQTGGATSRHFALVEAKNIQPTVDAGPDMVVDEGQVVTLVGHFEDVEYLDTHESDWNFGDQQPPQMGVIQESNKPPRAVGTSTVQHAWCDNGSYTVTLRVRDQNGGFASDTMEVTVRNVPPTVDAGPALFTYPCSALTLVAHFTDPGWCDTHTAVWDFGDCTPAQMAVVEEDHKPPAGHGTATASHCYEHCGTYSATCTVTDDDGGVGQAAVIIRVIDVQNKDFEAGFRRRIPGLVANFWEPYPAGLDKARVMGLSENTGVMPQLFEAEEFVVHDGQRSQHILNLNSTAAGIYQQVGANLGWIYQVNAWYSLEERFAGAARLGLDPLGGVDPQASSVIWTEGTNRRQWDNLTVRVTAQAGQITIFLECTPSSGQTVAPADGHSPASDAGAAFISRGLLDTPGLWFDDIALLAIQPTCVTEQPPQPPDPNPKEVCVDFSDLKPETQMPPEFNKDDFRFTAMNQRPQAIVVHGEPQGRSKLQLLGGELIDLPFPASRVDITLTSAGGFVETLAEDSSGQVLDRANLPSASPGGAKLYHLTLKGEGIVRVQITTRSEHTALVELCILS